MPIDVVKIFDKIHYPLKIKTLNSVGIIETYLNIIQVMHEKTTAYFIFNDEEVKSHCYKISNKTRMLILITFILHSTGSLSNNN